MKVVIAVFVACFVITKAAVAQSFNDIESFSVLTYNVAGLPDALSSGTPSVNTIKISPLLNAYQIVNVQEDFNYHDDLIAQALHRYKTPHSGVAGFGDGLGTFSTYPITDFKRVTWTDRYGLFDSGSDLLTPKGFSYARLTLKGGAFIDLYNLHADAGSDSGSLAARRSNMRQLYNYILANSAGNAFIVMGDTNNRYTRAEDIMEEFLEATGGKDGWIEIVRGGSIPANGDALTDNSQISGPNYEVVDKIVYRSSRAVRLTPSNFRLPASTFKDGNGNDLSDHYPVAMDFSYGLASDVSFSPLVGGSGGSGFNDLAKYTEGTKPAIISIRTGARVDNIGIAYANGQGGSHGGTGGTPQELTLEAGEKLTSAYVCQGTRNDDYRIFYISLRTSLGRVLSGGTETGSCTNFVPPYGSQIIGFYGRSGDNVDKLGAVYMP